MENNSIQNRFRWIYLLGFFIILALPLFNLPPWFYPTDWGKAIAFRSILAIMLFAFVCQILNKKGDFKAIFNGSTAVEPLKRNKIVWALAAFFIVFLLASIFSVDSYFSFWASPYRGGGFITFAFYFIFAILALILFKGDDWKKAWIFSIITGIFVCAIALFQFYGLFNKIFVSVSGGMGSTIGNPIFLGIYLLLLFFPTLAFAIKEKNKYLKIFDIFSLLIFLYVIAITGSRASYLGLVAGAMIFLFFYPKKANLLKITAAGLIVSILAIVLYINFGPQLPKSISSNRILSSVTSRLSLKKAFADERYLAWQTVTKEILDKPILGWGPENLAVGFDKNYNPNITWSPWWDRAHNIFLQIGAEAGILGIIAYLSLFIVLFWQLHKVKHADKNADINAEKTLITHGIQATLVGYLVANFFSFDSFPTYLLFFFIIGYSLHLTTQNDTQSGTPVVEQSSLRGKAQNYTGGGKKGRGIIIGISLIILIIFLWQYNFVPFKINIQINIANNLTDNNKCDQAFSLLDKELGKRSFVDSYLRMSYVNGIKACATQNPDKNLEYARKGVKLLKEAVKIQPLYTRYWIYLGSFTTIMANNERNQTAKQSLVEEAYSYFDKAEKLSPNRQETILEVAKTDMVDENYQKMEQDAQKCIEIKSDYGNCYWMKALAELYLQEESKANGNIQIAKKYGFDYSRDTFALYQLIDFYDKNQQYDKLAGVYEKLILINSGIAQYHSSLAFAYAKLGRYTEARDEATAFLKLMPEAKDEVNAFLKTLPY